MRGIAVGTEGPLSVGKKSKINHKKVLRITRERGWLCHPRKKKWICTTDSNHNLPIHPKLIKDLSLDRINQLVHCVSEKQAWWLKSEIEKRLNQCGLELHPDKTRIVYCKSSSRKGNYPNEKFDFLGYTFRYDRDLRGRDHRYLNLFPSAKSLARERQALREMTGVRTCYQPIPQLIGGLNAHLNGWSNYFSQGYPREAFRRINQYVRERLYVHLQRRSQRPWRPPKGTTAYAQFAKMGLVYL